jgi:hypothetical protein
MISPRLVDRLRNSTLFSKQSPSFEQVLHLELRELLECTSWRPQFPFATHQESKSFKIRSLFARCKMDLKQCYLIHFEQKVLVPVSSRRRFCQLDVSSQSEFHNILVFRQQSGSFYNSHVSKSLEFGLCGMKTVKEFIYFFRKKYISPKYDGSQNTHVHRSVSCSGKQFCRSQSNMSVYV